MKPILTECSICKKMGSTSWVLRHLRKDHGVRISSYDGKLYREWG